MISTCFILILLCHPTEVKAGLDGSLFSLDLDCVQLVRSAFIMFVGSQRVHGTVEGLQRGDLEPSLSVWTLIWTHYPSETLWWGWGGD